MFDHLSGQRRDGHATTFGLFDQRVFLVVRHVHTEKFCGGFGFGHLSFFLVRATIGAALSLIPDGSLAPAFSTFHYDLTRSWLGTVFRTRLGEQSS